jgi:hypothetical protein
MEQSRDQTITTNLGKDKHVYKTLNKTIKKTFKQHIIINCSNCNETLFTNQEIIGFYIISLTDFYITIDPECLRKILNIHFTDVITNNHQILPEKTLIAQILQCPHCFADIGAKIISAGLNKEFLLQKYLVPVNKLSAFIIDEYNCYDFDFKTIFQDEQTEKYLKELKILNKKLEENLDDIGNSLNIQYYFIKVKKEMYKAIEQLDRLIKIAKYNNFICK